MSGLAVSVTPLVMDGPGAAPYAGVGNLLPSPTDSASALYTVLLREAPLATYAGEVAGIPAPERLLRGDAGGKLDLESAAALAYINYLSSRQEAFIADFGASIGRALDVRARMQHALNGIVVELTGSEAALLAANPDVLIVEREHQLQLHTDNGPTYTGAPSIWDGNTSSGAASKGEGIVVGIVDTGINWESPAFAAISPIDGYVHQNPRGTGNYLGLCGATAPNADLGRCNDKLIGIYNFASTVATRSGADTQGHGSHTASTVAGNHWTATFASGSFTVSGVAPRANVISYLACPSTCPSTATSQSVNQAVIDGVDVLNYSISGGTSPWTDTTSIAFRNANAAGMFVAASAGNTSTTVPDPQGQVNHMEPWVETVAASTQNRVIAVGLDLDGGPTATQNVPMRPGGAPLPTTNLYNVPIIKSPNFADGANDGCAAYPANTFTRPYTVPAEQIFTNGFDEPTAPPTTTGAIAVLRLGTPSNCASGARRTAALNAGAVGVIFVDPVYLNLGAGDTSWSMLSADWATIEAAMNPATATVSIDISAAAFAAEGDLVAGFSFRGPRLVGGQGMVKPDITAPGVDILAVGAANVVGANGVYLSNGTSMSGPHMAGAAALMRAINPSWTAPQIKSALNMSSNNFGSANQDGTPVRLWDYGSGRVNLTAAAKVGLTMDETAANFLAANPAAGGDISTLNLASMAKYNAVGSTTFTRTFRRAKAGTQAYTLAIAGLPAGSATVSPTSFTINTSGTRTITVTVNSALLPEAAWALGELLITPTGGDEPNLHLPIAVYPGGPQIAVAPSSLSGSSDTTVSNDLTITNTANPTLNWQFQTSGTAVVTPFNTPTTTTGQQGGYYVGVSRGYHWSQNFDVGSTMRVTTLRANGFTLPSTTALTATNTPLVIFSIYADNAGDPAGAPEGFGAAPLWTYSAAIGAANGITTTGGAISLNLNAANVVGTPLNLPAGRYWLTVSPRINGTGAQTAANPLWAWYTSDATPIGSVPKLYAPWSDPLAFQIGATANMLSGFVQGTVDCAKPSWVTFGTTSGTIPSGSQAVPVTFDAAGLSAGSYSGALCITSNATNAPVVSVPLNFTVPNGGSQAPTLSKAFAPTSINAGGSSTLTITLNNSAATASTLTAPLVDNFPSDLVVAATPAAATTCPSGTVTAVAGAGSVSLSSGAQIPPTGSCTVTVDVTSAVAGGYENIIAAGALQTSSGNNAAAASATFAVNAVNYTVTPSVNGSNGTISPDVAQTVSAGGTATFTLTPDSGYQVGTIGGTCGGTLTGNSYTTAPVTASCTVIANFVLPFPAPYCARPFTSAVEPITLVRFGSIDNTTTNVLAGAPPLENFLHLSTAVAQSAIYPITVKGNADGNFVNAYRAYIDWDQNGVFAEDASERYELGSITGSTGIDALQLTANLTIPASAASGTTRMRIVKKYQTAGSACGGDDAASTSYGQAEDYTITVDPNAPSPPALSKTFTPTYSAAGTTTKLTLNIGSSNAAPITLTADFVDTFPVGMVIATPAMASTTCGGTLTATAGTGSITLPSGSTIPNGGCTISVDTTAANGGIYVNTTSPLATSVGMAAAATATYQALQAGLIAYSTGFESPYTVAAINGQQGWSARASNVAATTPANGAQHMSQSALASPSATTNPLAISPTFAAGTAPYASISANLRISRTTNGATWRFNPQDPAAGLLTTIIQFERAATRNIQIATWNAGSGTLVNTGAIWPIDTYFNLKFIVERATGATRLCFNGAQVYENLAGNGTTGGNNISNVSISQFVQTGNTAGNTFLADDLAFDYSTFGGCGAPVVTHTVTPSVTGGNGTISPNTVQTVNSGATTTFALTPASGYDVGPVTGSCPAGSTSSGVYTTGAITADCTVIASFTPALLPASVAKAFASASVEAGTATALTITLTNPNAVPVSLSSALTDNLPAGVLVAPAPAAATTCTAGTVTAAAGATSVSLGSGAQIPANGDCTVTASVRAVSPGSYVNTIPAGALQTNGGASVAAASATLEVTAGGFPAPYCARSFSTTEPITLVNFAGINNTSPETVTTGVGSLQNFLSVVGSVRPSASYLISLAGNTDGATFTSYFRVYIDWNQDGTFAEDASERYEAGSVTGSTGLDTIRAGALIAVPASAVIGSTRMRVVKNFGAVGEACGLTTSTYGQAEDYTLTVDPAAAAPGLPYVSMSFAPAVVPAGSPSTLTISASVVNGTSPVNTTAALTNSLPTGLLIAATPNSSTTCSGALTADPGSSTISLAAGASIPPAGCTISVAVSAANPGIFNNTLPVGALATADGANTIAASASLRVIAATFNSYNTGFEAPFTTGNLASQQGWSSGSTAASHTISTALPATGAQHLRLTSTATTSATQTAVRAISPTQVVGAGTHSVLTAKLRLVNTGAGTTWDFNPQDPVAGVVSTLLRFNRAGARNIQVPDFNTGFYVDTGATWPLNVYFDLSLSFNRAAKSVEICIDGTTIYNATNAVSSPYIGNLVARQNGETGNNAGNTMNIDDLVISNTDTPPTCAPPPPSVAMAFAPSGVEVNEVSTLTLTLNNSASTPATLSADLVNTFPAGLVVANPAAATTTCVGGTVGAVSGGGSVSLSSGAQIPSGGCTVSVAVLSATNQDYVNTIAASALQTTNGSNANAASAPLFVGNLLITVTPNIVVPADGDGVYFDFLAGTNSTTSTAGSSWNPYGTTNLQFFWANTTTIAGAAVAATTGGNFSVLSSGATIGPSSVFSSATTATATINFRQAGNVDGYLGIRFTNTSVTPARVLYGYVHMTTTGATGHPATVLSYTYNRAGLPVTIP